MTGRESLLLHDCNTHSLHPRENRECAEQKRKPQTLLSGNSFTVSKVDVAKKPSKHS